MLDVNRFDQLHISLATSDDVRTWSHGEVKKPETINYRTLKPERDGLFCERIFGPTRDWECACGKYKRPRFKGIVCERCGVEVTRSKVRRERMGHIELAAPVTHIWYFKGVPSRLGYLLDIAPKDLEKVIYFAAYMVTSVDEEARRQDLPSLQSEYELERTAIEKALAVDLESRQRKLEVDLLEAEHEGQKTEAKSRIKRAAEADLTRIRKRAEADVLRLDTVWERFSKLKVGDLEGDEDLYREMESRYSDYFEAFRGAEAIKRRLETFDLEGERDLLVEAIESGTAQRKARALKRIKVVNAFLHSGTKPTAMVLDALPVIPPDLRPMVQLDGGRFATSDLNDLYRRVINRNNRLKRMLDLGAPEIMVNNEKRMLQEAVDALFDNGRRGRPVQGAGNRPLKSLSDMLKGKQGRFRQNLLGKRVDYSGRSVIVVGPDLKLHQCGLPTIMALELFKPFVQKRLVDLDIAKNVKAAKRLIDRQRPEVWDVLEDVIKEHPVLLNRAPTLHRLGIQAFEPVLTEGRALKLHPLACTAYNADFDGDQMAIHLPLSAEAQTEARVLMLAANHILAPKDGKPIIVPSQDMVLGSYYLTKVRPGAKGEGKVFTGISEALLAYQEKVLDLQAEIRVQVEGYGLVRSSLGRLIFSEILPNELRHYRQDAETGEWSLGVLMNKKELGKLVANCYDHFGATKTAEVIDHVKNLGYHYACIAGMTVAVSDVIVPPKKKEIIADTQAQVNKVERQFGRGLITEDERYKKVVQLWTKATDDVADAMMENMDPFNPIFMMADSGARGNKQQMRQLAGMRGLMADPSGKIIDLPITANFREGLTVSDYFISSHGARKGLADTALRTADSGYLTRRLVDVAQDVIVREEDCDVTAINLMQVRARLAESTFDALELLVDSLMGRLLAAAVYDPKTKDVLYPQDTVLDDEVLETIGERDVREIMVRGSSVNVEGAVSNAMITESITLGEPDARKRKKARTAVIRELSGKEVVREAVTEEGTVLAGEGTVLTDKMVDAILNSELHELHIRNNNVRGIEVEAITEGTGVIESLADRIVGRVLAEDVVDEATGEVIAHINDPVDEELAKRIEGVRKRVSIRSVLTCKSQFGVCMKCYGRDLANQAEVEIGEAVGIIAAQSIGEPGTQLTMRTFHSGGVAGDDITQGLPRVEELFEARKPKHNAIIAENEGVAAIEDTGKGMRTVTITPEGGVPREYTVPFGARMAVREGAELKIGDKITEGSINPHDILRVCGLQATQRYLVYEVQKVYKSQGVEINDKHIEVMVRQMLHKVKIEEAGTTEFLPGEYIEINTFEAANTKAIEEDGEPAVAKPILLGITKASLATDSFLSAASFQETTRVLTDAAIKGKIDPLVGLKENVIIGKLIPAGTGMTRYRNLDIIDHAPAPVKQPEEEIVEEVYEEVDLSRLEHLTN